MSRATRTPTALAVPKSRSSGTIDPGWLGDDSFSRPDTPSIFESLMLKNRPWIDITHPDYGADPLGIANSTEAILAAYADLPVGGVLFAPFGSYIFTEQLLFSGQKQFAFLGQNAVFRYGGSDTELDCMVFGNGVDQEPLLYVNGFTVLSDTTMTAGAGVRFKKVVGSRIKNFNIDHQYGTGKWFNAVWFDEIDNVVFTDFQARGANDGLRVNGGDIGTPCADLCLDRFKIARCGAAGIRIGGGFGGFKMLGGGQCINNATNIIADRTLQDSANREVNISGTLDSACTLLDGETFDGIGLDIQDTGGIYQVRHAWISSAGTLVRLGDNFTGKFKMDGGWLMNAFNTFGGPGDGVIINNVDSMVDIMLPGVSYIQGKAFNNNTGGTLNYTRIAPLVGPSVATLFYAIAASSVWFPIIANTRIGGALQVGAQATGPILKNHSSSLALRNAADNDKALPVHADNAAALAAGMSAGDLYCTSTGQVQIVY